MKFTEDYLKQAERLLVDLFTAERPKLLKAFGNVEHTFKGDATPVTQLDKNMEATIKKALLKFDPSVGMEGEEFGREGSDKTFWLIDPIDGTESFIRGLPTPRNVVTLIDNGQIIYTMVYKFVTDEWYIATKGKGAFRNGKQVHVSERPLDRAWIEYGTNLADPQSLKRYLAIRPHVHGYTVMRDFPAIASGGIDGMISDEGYGGAWDYAPRALLFEEAGAKVTNAGSDHFDFRVSTIFAAAPENFDKLHELYKQN